MAHLAANVAAATPILAFITALLTTLHLTVARPFRGHRSGTTLTLPLLITVHITAVTLAVTTFATTLSHFLHLILTPTSANTTHILPVAAALYALHYSGHLLTDRRRRLIAIRLASIPVFGDGTHAPSHQPLHQSSLLSTPSSQLQRTPSQAPPPSTSTITPSPTRFHKRHHSLPIPATRPTPIAARLDLTVLDFTTDTATTTSTASSTCNPSNPPSTTTTPHATPFHSLPRHVLQRPTSRTFQTGTPSPPPRPPPPGPIRRLVCQLVCRTAAPWTFTLRTPHPPTWPLNTIRATRLPSLRRLLLVRDPVIQDGAGARLLHPSFTHSLHLDRSAVAATVFAAVHRSALCCLTAWMRKTRPELFERFARLPAVDAVLRHGALRRAAERAFAADVADGNALPFDCASSSSASTCSHDSHGDDGESDDGKEDHDEDDGVEDDDDDMSSSRAYAIFSRKSNPRIGDCYLTDIAWAVITAEVLDYLEHKRDETPFLNWLVRLPDWLCKQKDDVNLDVALTQLMEEWMTGRRCGYRGWLWRRQPCDSHCCCHGVRENMTFVGCGCQCPCVCTCA